MVRLMPGDLIYEDRNGDNKIESKSIVRSSVTATLAGAVVSTPHCRGRV